MPIDAPPKLQRNQRRAPGHWANPRRVREHLGISENIRVYQQDKLIMSGRPVYLWVPVGEQQVGASPGGGVGGNVGAVRCTCVASAAVRADRICVQCFAPGTLVRTEAGYRAIEQIQIGDRVLSSDGSYQRVTKTIENHYHGDMVSVRASTSAGAVLTTPNHPYLALSQAHGLRDGCKPHDCDGYIARGDGAVQSPPDVRRLPGGRWHARATLHGKRIALGGHATREDAVAAVLRFRNAHTQPKHKLNWTAAETLSEKTWLTTAQPKNEDVDVISIDIPSEHLGVKQLTHPRLGPSQIDVTEEFLWVVGMYLAEGSSGSRTITFALHKQEVAFQNRLVAFFKGLGYNPEIRLDKADTDNGAVVAVNSTTLAGWFPQWLGHLCYNKRIPEEFMRLPAAKLWALLDGIYDGDGCKRESSITQTSRVLALQISELLFRLGEQPSLRVQQSQVLTPRGNKRAPAYCVSWTDEDECEKRNRKYHWNFGGHHLAQIRSLDRVQYCGPVYNLEVEGTHTYVVESLVVHNCYGTGWAPGYLRFGHDTISALAAHAAPSADGYGGEAWTLSNVELDTSIRPWRFVLSGVATSGTIVTTDRAFTVTGGAAMVTAASGGQWSQRLEYSTRDGGTVSAEYSTNAGGLWRPITDIVSVAPPDTSGNIRFRFTLTRPDAAYDGPALDGLRIRRAVPTRVNPLIERQVTEYVPGQILILRTFVDQQFVSALYGGQAVLHNGDRGWTAPLDFFDPTITENTPACRVPDGEVGPHAFYQHSEGPFADRRYALTGVQYSTEVGVGTLTSQSWSDRLITPAESSWLVW